MSGSAGVEELFRAFYPRLVAMLTMMLLDVGAAEDVAQEAFVKLLRDPRSLEEFESPAAWLKTVAVRDAVRLKKRSRRFVRLEGWIEQAWSPWSDGRPEVHAALESVSRNQRIALVLRYTYGFLIAEIANLTGWSESTARVHLHRGRNRVAELLALGEGEEVAP